MLEKVLDEVVSVLYHVLKLEKLGARVVCRRMSCSRNVVYLTTTLDDVGEASLVESEFRCGVSRDVDKTCLEVVKKLRNVLNKLHNSTTQLGKKANIVVDFGEVVELQVHGNGIVTLQCKASTSPQLLAGFETQRLSHYVVREVLKKLTS